MFFMKVSKTGLKSVFNNRKPVCQKTVLTSLVPSSSTNCTEFPRVLPKRYQWRVYKAQVQVLNPFTGQDVYRRPELAAFLMGRTCISVLTGLAVSDAEKPRYLVL